MWAAKNRLDGTKTDHQFSMLSPRIPDFWSDLDAVHVPFWQMDYGVSKINYIL